MKRHSQIIIAGAMALMAAGVPGAVSTTKHNLSTSGPGTVKATSESQICVFCHTPHSAAANSPLWNRRTPGSAYTPYTSSTAIAAAGQPTGASILCLSCHDGTIALGEVLSSSTQINMSGGVTTMPVGPGRLGTDLSDDHPISFNYTATLASQRGELVNPSTLTGAVKLDRNGQLQCTSCHNAHEDTNGKFLVMANTRSALCQTCHVKNYWSASAHNTSNAAWNGVAPDPWPASTLTTVSANACQNCHKPHAAGGRQRLLNSATEETNCSVCHNAHVAQKDIMTEFNKFSRHPITSTTGVHDPKEAAVVATRHVECYDCHNPHAARAGTGTPPGPLTGVRGVGITGTEVNPATREYEICFRCHADSPNKPAARTTRQLVQTNVRLEFDLSNPSYHPVEGAGKNPNVPSLAGAPANFTTSSVISCSDCHNNDTGPKAGGIGPNGPHGSAYAPLLVRQYLTADPTTESATAYALCYNCHNRTSILGNQSFPRHSLHVGGGGGGGGMGGGGGGMGGINSPCNNCHDPHGISSTQGNSVNNSKLINFNTAVVSPSSSGILRFESTGTFHGRCYLSCHGHNHNPETY